MEKFCGETMIRLTTNQLLDFTVTTPLSLRTFTEGIPKGYRTHFEILKF